MRVALWAAPGDNIRMTLSPPSSPLGPPTQREAQRPFARHYAIALSVGLATGVPAVFPLLALHIASVVLFLGPWGVTDTLPSMDEGTTVYVTIWILGAAVTGALIAAAAIGSQLWLHRHGGARWWLTCTIGVLAPYLLLVMLRG